LGELVFADHVLDADNFAAGDVVDRALGDVLGEDVLGAAALGALGDDGGGGWDFEFVVDGVGGLDGGLGAGFALTDAHGVAAEA